MKIPNEDITLCMNDRCTMVSCKRNPLNALPEVMHSYAWLEGTEYCAKKKEEAVSAQKDDFIRKKIKEDAVLDRGSS